MLLKKRRTIFVSKCCPDAWQGKEPVPVEALFEFDIPHLFGIETGYQDLSRMDIRAHGYTDLVRSVSYVDSKVADDCSESGRKFFRSTIAHEMGHCLLHVPLNMASEFRNSKGVWMLREQKNLRAFEDPEWQAWEMAKNICMPEHLVTSIVRHYGPHLATNVMVDTFDVSYTFAQSRLKGLIKTINPTVGETTVGQKYAKKPKSSANWQSLDIKPSTKRTYKIGV